MATTAKTGAMIATKSKTGKMENSEFHKFFVDELKDIYWAEKHLTKALPKMKKAATSPELAAAFEKHTEETQMHINTLEQVFELLDERAQAKKCDAMEDQQSHDIYSLQCIVKKAQHKQTEDLLMLY